MREIDHARQPKRIARRVVRGERPASDALVAAFIRKLQPLGTGVLRYGLVCLLLFWGGLKFLFSTPGVLDPMSPAFGFLVKDLILLGAALYTAGEALHAPE